MKRNLVSPWRLAWVACALALHLCTTTASSGAIIAGPITNAANGHIYYLLSPTNWPSAEAEAVSLGGHLATINDAAENTWVFNTFGSFGGVARFLWIGLNDAAQEGNWVWVGGEAAAYRNWAPGEPNNGGGFFPNEDQAAIRGPAFDHPDSWNDAPGDQVHAAVVELIALTPPSTTATYDVAANFSTNSNPNSVWSYGYSTVLAGPMTLHAERGTSAGLSFWRTDLWRGVPGVYHNAANTPATNGTVVVGPRQLFFHPGPNAELCLIRFRAPTNGEYRVLGAFTGVDTAGTVSDVYIIVNGVTFTGAVNGYGAGSGPTFNLIARLGAGDTLDFAVGQRNGHDFCSESTGLSAQIVLDTNAPPVGAAPTITSHPQSQTATAGANVTFTVVATGTAPLSYQWRRNETNLVGATGTSLTLSNVQPASAGTYSVRVTNAFGVATSSNALLTVLSPLTSCVGAPAGLVSWWRAESNALDSVDSNHGTLAGNTTFGPGRVGQGFVFDGNGDGVRIGNPTNLQLQDFTIEAWIKRASTAYVSSGPGLDSVFFSYGSGGYGFGLDRLGGRPVLSQIDANSLTPTANITIADTNFHHLAVTKSGVAVVFYVDGVAYSAPPDSSTFTFASPAAIGATGDNLRASFFGTVDELAIYNRALSTAELQAIYNAGITGKCTGATSPVIFSQPTDQTVVVGETATFTVLAGGTFPLSYRWRFNGTNINGATGSSIVLTNVQFGNAGGYSVVVSNLVGTVASSNAVLTVNPPPPCVTPPSGLVGWWRGEANALDQSGTNNGTILGNTTFGAGRVGQGFVFDSSGDGVNIGNPTNLQLQSFTIEAWIKRASTAYVSSGPGLDSVFFSYGSGGYGFGLDRFGGRPVLSLIDVSSVTPTANVTIADTNFHHLAVTKTAANVVFYVDGLAYPAPAYSATFAFITQAAIGATGDGLRASFFGTVDELAIYNRALSASEVQGIYHAGGSGKCSPATGVLPTIISHPQSRTVAVGTNVTFIVTATGSAPLSYQWRRNETNLPGATGPSLTLSNVQPANAGTYSVRVTNAFGSVTSSNAVLTVLSPPSPVLAGPITNPANGHVYFLIASNTWTGAEAQAVALGGHLVTINDASENAWVLSTFGSFGGIARPLWIGLNDAAVEGVFVWISGEAAAYRNWMPGEPNNGGGFVPDEDYVGMRGPGLSFSNAWNDTLNSDLYVGVVEIGSVASPTNCLSAPTGLVSWWRAEGNANDSKGTNNGTTPFGIAYVGGEVGQAFDFNGTSRRVSVPDSPELKLTNSFTLEGWIYARQSNSGVIFIRGDNRASLDPVLLTMLQLPGNVAFQIQNADSQSVLLQAPVQLNQWQHIAAMLDGPAVRAMRVYVNGVVRAQTNTTVRPFANLDPNQQPAIGIGNHGGTIQQFPFNGLIDEISLYSRALSSNEVYAIYSAGSAGKCSGPPKIEPIGVTSLVREPGAGPRLHFAGVAGKLYVIQASTNLVEWQIVGNSVADADGICMFEDPDATRFPCRYYRVVVPDQD